MPQRVSYNAILLIPPSWRQIQVQRTTDITVVLAKILSYR